MTDPSSRGAPEPPVPAGPRIGSRAAVGLVFGSSAAVLVVEIVALRLLAPYLGLTLETSTLVIGIALAAIATGSWAGGRVADTFDARNLIGPALGVSGAVVALTPSLLRYVGEHASQSLLLVAALTIMVPGTLLAAVTPMVTELRLDSLDRTGTVVGQLSGTSTLGAIVGTVVTGFVLISRLSVSTILLGLGAALVLAAVLVMWGTRRAWLGAPLALVVAAGGSFLAVAPGGCDVETKYHCARVVAAPDGSPGRTLVLDNLRHSHVDLEDPTHLEFGYVRAIASVIETAFPDQEPIRAHHLGAGGLTIPRWLSAVRPGTESTVSEIDGGVVRIDRERLELDHPDIEVRIEDGRLGLEELRTDSVDLIVGDAFGGVSVPWHLTTVESLTEVRRSLTAGGVYVANLIDFGEQDFARAEAATMAEVFEHVLVLGQAVNGGNLVVIGSDRRLDTTALQQSLNDRGVGWRISEGAEVAAWTEGSPVLTDDYAPVDQLLQPDPAFGR